jgi:hypothetical protein
LSVAANFERPQKTHLLVNHHTPENRLPHLGQRQFMNLTEAAK